MNLIILQESDIQRDGKIVLSDYRAEHVIKVIKPAAGDKLEVGLINESIAQAEVEHIEKGRVILKCQFDKGKAEKNNSHIDIVCALPRPQTLKKVLHSAGAMSVRNIFFIRSNRVEKSYFHSPMLLENNYSKHLIEGMSQGKNVFMPSVSFHDRFKVFMEDTLSDLDNKYNYKKFVFSPDTDQTILDKNITASDNILLAIGPEGGWVPFELDTMANVGFDQLCLGPWILRVENAMVAALSQLQLAL